MLNILYLCADNACRSIIAEALTNRMGQGRVRAFSAGDAPAGTLYPGVRALLHRQGFATENLHPKAVTELVRGGLPPIDLAICLCDNCGGEFCRIPDEVNDLAHWQVAEISNPSPEGRLNDLRHLFDDLHRRVEHLLSMPQGLGRAPLLAIANHIGWRPAEG